MQGFGPFCSLSLNEQVCSFSDILENPTSSYRNFERRVQQSKSIPAHWWWLVLALFGLGAAQGWSQIKIMPMGDSITVGVDYLTNSTGGYRDPLYRDLKAAGVSVTFVGATSTNPTAALTAAGQTYHNGYGGWRIQDLNNNLDGVAAPMDGGDSNQGGYFLTGGNGTGRPAMTPDVILLEIGTNDLLQGSTTINQDLLDLVTHIHALTPNTVILIAGVTPINSAGFTASVNAYNAYIKNTLVPSLYYTRFVDQNSAFLNADGSVNGPLLGSDLVHPNRFGYPILALHWAAAIEALEGVTASNNVLTVANGSGSGSYPGGTVVTVEANAPVSGTQFANWSPATTALSEPFSSLATYTMPASATTLTANYTTAGNPVVPNGTYQIQSPFSMLSMAAAGTADQSAMVQQAFNAAAAQEWDLTNLGNNTVTLMLTGTREALEVPASTQSTLGAALDVATYTGGANQQWTILPANGTMQLKNVGSGLVVNIQGYSTGAGTPLDQYSAGLSNDVWDFFPVSPTQPTYALTVTNGTGGGSYVPGTTVAINANPAPAGYTFAGWTGATAEVASASSASTTVVTSNQAATITATYNANPVTYALVVNSGTGSGTYAAGTTVTITANAPASGYQFAGWTGSTAALANASASTTTLTMPSAAASVTATYTATVSTTSAAPRVVGVQFVGGGAAPLHGAAYDYTAGASNYAAGHWNSVLSTGDTIAPQALTVTSGLTDSQGSASTIGFQLKSSGAYYTGAGSGFTASPAYPGYPGRLSGSGDAFLFAGFAYAGFSDKNPLSLTVTGLNPAHTYSLIAYITPFEQFGDAQTATVSLTGGTTYYVRTAGKLGTYQRAASTSQSAPTAGNYVEFDNLSGSATQVLTFTNTSQLVGLSGFQVVDAGAAAAVPTATLTVNGGTGSGTYAVGSNVTVTANTPASGYQFAAWSGATSILASASSATTVATVPAGGASITATDSVIPPTSTAPAASGATVSVQFVGGGAAPLRGNGYNYTAGSGAFATTNWNSVLATGNTTSPQSTTVSSGLVDSTGAASSIGFHLSASGAYYTGAGKGFTGSPMYPGCPGALSGPGDAFLYAGFAYAGYSNATPLTLSITGLNASHTYSVLLYYTPFQAFGNSQTATASVTGGPTYYLATNGSAGTYQRSASTSAAAPGTGNFVEFDGLTGSTSQTVTFTNTATMVGVSGFQVVDVTAASSTAASSSASSSSAASSSSTSSSSPTPSSTVPAGYHLTFDDEFNSLSISDVNGAGTKWYSHTVQCCMYDTSTPSTPTYMAGITAPAGQDPYSLVSGGGLDIRLQKTNGAWYSGVLATVDSTGKGFAQQYGYFEMMAKFPSAPGTWPAFWLLNSAALTSQANAGEIDVVESYMQFPNYVNTTLHDWTPPATTPFYQQAQVANLSSGYHIFGMLWTAQTITFYCDGVKLYSTPTPAIMNQPYYPIIDLGLGGGWPTNQTPQQNDMIVKYVRVYAP